MSNDGRPHRVVATGIYELPFGKGKRFAASAPALVNHIVGGWQLAATYEWQPGPMTDWGNRFYYNGDPNDIAGVERTWDRWFDNTKFPCGTTPSGPGFEACSDRQPADFHRRVFPTRLEGIRRDSTNQWNANVSKNIRVNERWNRNMQLRLDALNLQNRSQMENPNTDPFSSNFGRITSQTSATNRWIQVQMRLTF
jgi:hypothetical protein